MKVINSLSDLRNSKFGRPDPQHGLELLHWFSREYIDVDINNCMKPKLDHPRTGAFGFRLFHNNEQILPRQNLYYEVGNLHGQGANGLPQYVRKKDTHQYDGSNKDRIIIRLNGSNIEKVYVTEHKDQKNFNPDQTYEVSHSVIREIRAMELKQFLNNCNNNLVKPINQSHAIHMPEIYDINLKSNTSKCWCTIL